MHKRLHAFTLIELLIVIGILAILAVAVVMVINPIEIFRKARDAQRLAEINAIDSGINIGKSLNPNLDASVATSTVYISLPDNASSTCGSYSLPSLDPGWSYKCVTEANLRKVDSNGWIPINFASIVTGPPFASLPIDPVNTAEGGLYYTYIKGSWELTAVFESSEYKTQYPNSYKKTSATEAAVPLTPYKVANRSLSKLVYSTYLGGSSGEAWLLIALDSSGNAYIAGQSASADFPTTLGAYQTTYGGGAYDVFIGKLNSDGTGLIYSTYLGGSGDDGAGIAHSLTLDSSGNVYIAGRTASADFPTTGGAYQTTYGGGTFDAFVAKLNPAGNSSNDLIYSTYLGGSGDDRGNSLVLDSSENVYVGGRTSSANFPTTTGAYQTTYGGGADAFIAKLNSSGTSLLYSTYLGGSGSDTSAGITLDSSGNVYISGRTASANFPTTLSAYQTTYGGGANDVFVAKLNPAGNSSNDLIYSTYLGGSDNDSGQALVLDSSKNAIVTGITASTSTFPITSGAYQTIHGGGPPGYVWDWFITKFNDSGTDLIFSTYLGGNGTDANNFGIALDSSENIYVAGSGDSSDFPTTSGAYQTAFGGIWDTNVAELNPSGTDLIYSTYLGGSGDDTGVAFALESLGMVYITGHTESTDFPITSGAYQTTFSGGWDAFITKINPQ